MGRIEIEKDGALYTTYRMSCCGYSWTENNCDNSSLPEFTFCPGCAETVGQQKGDNMELKDTIEGMTSPDYKERFKAEYQQLAIRREKLLDLIKKAENNELDFEPTCSLELLWQQHAKMRELEEIYLKRAEIEGIEL